MKIFAYFLILLTVKKSLCKSTQTHKQDSDTLEGDTLIDKILAADRFTELADKIVDKTIAKINNEQLSVARNAPAIETKKSNDFHAYQDPEFKSVKTEEKDVKHVKTTKSQRKQKRYKPGKINVEAVLQKKIQPSDDLAFRYNQFTKSSTNRDLDKSPPQKLGFDEVKVLNEEPEIELTTSKHKVIKKPSANDSSEEKNKSETEKESKSAENEKLQKTTPTSDLSAESTKFADDSDITQVTKSKNGENPFGNEKVIVWNKKDDSDSEDSDSDGKDIQQEEKKNHKVTQKIDDKTQTLATNKASFLFRADTVTESTPNDSVVNKVDNDADNDDYQGKDQDLQMETEKNKDTTKQIIRREGNKTYVLKESPDYKEYHEEIAKIRQINLSEEEIK